MRVAERRAERFRARAQRAIATRRIFRYLAGAMLVLSLAAGVFAWLVDRKDFQTLGDALWWALVTLATVGYGDVVPTTAWGRVIGAAVIVMGVTFLAILTSTVTSYMVSASQDEREDETRVLLRDVLHRLHAIEGALERDAEDRRPA